MHWKAWAIACAGLLATGAAVGCGEAKPKRTCTQDSDCFQDATPYVCDSQTKTCLRSCSTSKECLASQDCDQSEPAKPVCRLKTDLMATE